MIVGKKRVAVIAAAVTAALVLMSSNRALAGSEQILDLKEEGSTIESPGEPTQHVDGKVKDDKTIGPGEIPVFAKWSGGGIKYRVIIQSGKMEFEYNYGRVWDTNTHSYTGSNTKGWVTDYVQGQNKDLDANEIAGTMANNGIHIINFSNFPVDIELKYERDDTAMPGDVVGLFATENTVFTSTILGTGASGSHGTASVTTNTFSLGMNESTGIEAGDLIYRTGMDEAPHIADRYFALAGKPGSGDVTAGFVQVGTITVTITPATFVTWFEKT